jgi:hypothetical protein
MKRISARASVQLYFEPSPGLVTGVAKVAADFCRLALEESETAARLHLAIHELVENVVKYSSNYELSLDIEFERLDGQTVLKMTTTNRTNPESLERVVKLLTDIKNADDPVAFYDRLVRAAAPQKVGSGIGLARIRAEAELDLDFSVDGDQLKVFVQAVVSDEQGRTR